MNKLNLTRRQFCKLSLGLGSTVPCLSFTFWGSQNKTCNNQNDVRSWNDNEQDAYLFRIHGWSDPEKSENLPGKEIYLTSLWTANWMA